MVETQEGPAHALAMSTGVDEEEPSDGAEGVEAARQQHVSLGPAYAYPALTQVFAVQQSAAVFCLSAYRKLTSACCNFRAGGTSTRTISSLPCKRRCCNTTLHARQAPPRRSCLCM